MSYGTYINEEIVETADFLGLFSKYNPERIVSFEVTRIESRKKHYILVCPVYDEGFTIFHTGGHLQACLENPVEMDRLTNLVVQKIKDSGYKVQVEVRKVHRDTHGIKEA